MNLGNRIELARHLIDLLTANIAKAAETSKPDRVRAQWLTISADAARTLVTVLENKEMP